MRSTSCCAIAVLLLAVAWAAPHEGDHQGHADDHFHHLHHSAGEAHTHSHAGEDTCHVLSPHNADFGVALYKSLSSGAAGKNIFFSPLGIAAALSMLTTGAKGVTHSQLFTALGYSSLTQEQVNAGYEHLIHMLGHTQKMQLDLGNALAIRNGFTPLQKFLDDAKHYYASEAFNVDFSKPVGAAAQINSFIARKTQDRITNLVKDLDPDTAMVLLNYVFFRGRRGGHSQCVV